MDVPPNDTEPKRVDMSSLGVKDLVGKSTSCIPVVTILPGSMFVDFSLN